MNLITKSALAKMCGVTRQAVNDALKRESLDQVGEGRTAKIDLDAYKTIQYIKHNNSQRKSLVHQIIKKTRLEKPPEKKGKSKAATKKQIKDDVIDDQEDSISITIPKSNGHGKDVDELLEIARRLEIAKMEKMEQQAIAEKLKNAARRGELIERERFFDLITYLDKLHSNLERLGDSFLSDVGGRIVKAKKVLPEHRSEWKSEIMSQIDETKNWEVEEIRKIEKEQSL